MDQSTPSASPVKSSSGIPRFSTSKLPTLRPTSVATYPASQDAKSALPSPSKPQSTHGSPLKPSLPQPSTISKRSSVVPTASQVSPSKTTAHRATQSVQGIGKRPSVYGTRPESRAASRLARPTPRKSYTGTRTEDTDDRLGSLDGFRAASRQGSRAESPSPGVGHDFSASVQTTPKVRKPSRPSLSDRTIESISRLPPTPVTERRRSSFFTAPSPMGPPSRPASAMSMSMRPGSSDGPFARPASRPLSPSKRGPASAKPASRMSVNYSAARGTPAKRGINAATPQTVQPVSRMSKPSGLVRPSSSRLTSDPGTSRVPDTPGTTAARMMRPPSSLGGAALKTVRPASSLGASVAKRSVPAPATAASRKVPGSPSQSAQPSSKPSSSSAALRDQIAKAKAAKRAAANASGLPQVDGGAENEFDLANDPFNAKPKDNKGLLLKRIDAARADGRLNIAALGLKGIPDEVLRMYDAEQMEKSNMTWSETVDLTRLIAADNEIEMISDNIFPDIDAEAISPEDEDAAKGLQFRGLEMLDLHGNALTAVPVGLIRLDRLTVINLVSVVDFTVYRTC